MSKRLEILKASLAKKEKLFDEKFQEHMGEVKRANGQPLNDKRNGSATLKKWAKQDDALRNQQESIEVTKRAIESEEAKIRKVKNTNIPDFLRPMLESGELIQWRKFPNRFFVRGVDKGRIVWNEKEQVFMHSHTAEVPKEQYPLFRDTFNKINRTHKELSNVPT